MVFQNNGGRVGGRGRGGGEHIFPVGKVNTLFFKIFNIIISVHVRDMRYRPFRHHLGPQNTPKHPKTRFLLLRMAFNMYFYLFESIFVDLEEYLFLSITAANSDSGSHSLKQIHHRLCKPFLKGKLIIVLASHFLEGKLVTVSVSHFLMANSLWFRHILIHRSGANCRKSWMKSSYGAASVTAGPGLKAQLNQSIANLPHVW